MSARTALALTRVALDPRCLGLLGLGLANRGVLLVTIDQFIALSASIGACLSAFATFLTVSQMARQREATYRPELALSRTPVRSLGDGSQSLPEVSTEKSAPGDETRIGPMGCRVPLRNVGLGAAKEVRVSWAFEINRTVDIANKLAQRSLVPAYFVYESEALSFKSDSMICWTSMWGNQQHRLIDYVLPAAVDDTPILLDVPHAYLQLASALVFFGARTPDKDARDIPTLNLRLDYLDIGGRTHRASFEIDLTLEATTGDGKILVGSFEMKKAV